MFIMQDWLARTVCSCFIVISEVLCCSYFTYHHEKCLSLLFPRQLAQDRSLSEWTIEGSDDSYQALRNKKDHHCPDRTEPLNQKASQSQTHWLATEGEQTIDTLDTALEMIRDDKQSIAELRRHIDGHNDKTGGIGNPQDKRIGRDGQTQPGDSPDPGRADGQLAKGKMPLQAPPQEKKPSELPIVEASRSPYTMVCMYPQQ